MHRLLGALTVRGRSFVAAGAAAVVCGLLIPEPDLLRIGALLMALPLLSAFGSGRARYRLSCVRQMTPSRLPAGQTTSLTIRLVNVSRLRTGLLLAEDTVPYALGSRPRFVFEGIGGGGWREFTYQLSADQALRNAGRLLQEGGVHAIKLEGGRPIAGIVRRLVEASSSSSIARVSNRDSRSIARSSVRHSLHSCACAETSAAFARSNCRSM